MTISRDDLQATTLAARRLLDGLLEAYRFTVDTSSDTWMLAVEYVSHSAWAQAQIPVEPGQMRAVLGDEKAFAALQKRWRELLPDPAAWLESEGEHPSS